jgi:hypothetical protein
VVPPPFPGLGTGYPIYESRKKDENGIGGVTHPLPYLKNSRNKRDRETMKNLRD